MPTLRIFLLALVALGTMPTWADTIAIIGTGNVGGALGPEFAAQGHTIVYGSRNPDKRGVRELVARTGDGASAASQAEAVKGADMGGLGNILAGGLGGVAGGQLLGGLLSGGAADAAAAAGGLDLAAMAGNLVGGGVAGLVVQVVVGMVLKKMRG